MQDNLYAVAKSDHRIEIGVTKTVCPFRMKTFRLYEEHRPVKILETKSINEMPLSYIYELDIFDFDFVPGKLYQIVTEQNFYVPLDISYLALTEQFEKKYRYDGRLGSIYHKERTIFRVYSPFSCEINLHICKKGSDKWEIYSMSHDMEHGVFEYVCEGDYDGAAYLYERYMFGTSLLVADPYSLSLSSNSRWSFVINLQKVRNISSNRKSLPEFTDRMKAIIYECSVRDMTSRTNVENKGTFHALSIPGLKDENGNPIGLDYLASLGVTHIQLLPVLDFQTVNEDDPSSSYNWGYDPVSYFSPEGSYAIDPNDGYDRVLGLKRLVSALHSKGLRVNLDVVYNHVFSNHFNPLNILCPKYYFRVDHNGNLSNGTGCGNDLESRRYMVRKLIIDSLVNALDLYDVDGYRFDLMGILDVDTINQAYAQLSKKKKNIMYYGEGWDLCTALPYDKKASTQNAIVMPSVSFFNDRFRDVAKGKSSDSELYVRGYLLGDTSYRDGFKHVMLGSGVPIAFIPMFSHAGQSVNYVECHDNHTLFDKIRFACGEDSLKEIHQRIKLNIFATLLAAGIPFFHQGEEIAGTKKGVGNSYNSGDDINGFDYKLLDQNKELYHFFIDAVAFKRECLSFSEAEYDQMMKEDRINLIDLEHGALMIDYEYKDNLYHVIFNPSKETVLADLPHDSELVFDNFGRISSNSSFKAHMAIVGELSVSVLLEREYKSQDSK